LNHCLNVDRHDEVHVFARSLRQRDLETGLEIFEFACRFQFDRLVGLCRFKNGIVHPQALIGFLSGNSDSSRELMD
jgi:hypothetical protein